MNPQSPHFCPNPGICLPLWNVHRIGKWPLQCVNKLGKQFFDVCAAMQQNDCRNNSPNEPCVEPSPSACAPHTLPDDLRRPNTQAQLSASPRSVVPTLLLLGQPCRELAMKLMARNEPQRVLACLRAVELPADGLLDLLRKRAKGAR